MFYYGNTFIRKIGNYLLFHFVMAAKDLFDQDER